jgi:N-acetylmuramic acid 6-phosphate etherase
MVVGIMAGGERALAHATEASEDNPALGAHDLDGAGFRSYDVLCGIAASGRTPYVLGAVARAKALGALTIGVCCVSGSALAAAVDYPIEPLTGPEVIAGSTRLKAGTATKLVLNMLSSGAMIRLGNVFSNLMINVQPTNAKLRDRAVRIVATLTVLPRADAETLLDAAGGNIRVAVLMSRFGLVRAAAEQRLAESHGRLREALGSASLQ